MSALAMPWAPTGWTVRSKSDSAANALADRHYSRRRPKSGQVGPPGRKLVLVTSDETAVWLTHWPFANMAMDGLDAWRCSIFRNESERLGSDLIIEAMDLTASMWGETPTDGWVTWVDTRKVRSVNPGYCFKKAGWWLDRDWHHRYLVRLRA